MTTYNIFISYSRKNRTLVEKFADDLKAMGHNVWFDVDISGGQEWWSAILKKIRECDLFIFALTNHSLNSEACKLEYEYALDLKKQFLPVSLADVNKDLLPVRIKPYQILDYQNMDKLQLLKLIKSLHQFSALQSLPDPLPPEPSIPLTPIDKLYNLIDASFKEEDTQAIVLAKLGELLKNIDYELNARQLLQSLKNRNDLLARTEGEIKRLLRKKTKNLALRQQLARLEPRTFVGHESDIIDVVFSPDAKYILSSGEDFTVKLWDAATGEEVHNFLMPANRATSVAFSPDGRSIFACSEDGYVWMWDVKTYKEKRKFFGYKKAISTIAVSSDGKFLAANYGFSIKLWEIDSGNEIMSINVKFNLITAIMFSPDNASIILAYDGTIHLHEAHSGIVTLELSGHTGYIRSVDISNNGNFLVSGSSDGTVRLWNIASGSLINTYPNYHPGVWQVEFSPSSEYFLVVRGDVNLLRILNKFVSTPLESQLGENVYMASFSPDGCYIVAGSTSGKIFLIPSGIDEGYLLV